MKWFDVFPIQTGWIKTHCHFLQPVAFSLCACAEKSKRTTQFFSNLYVAYKKKKVLKATSGLLPMEKQKFCPLKMMVSLHQQRLTAKAKLNRKPDP